MTKIPVLMCIDVEPDERLMEPNQGGTWRGFEIAFEFFSKLRSRLKDATGSPVHFCWFFRMDPEIEERFGSAGWVATHYSSLIEELRRAGDVFGLHIHAWRWNQISQTSGEWVLDLANQQWVDQCVRLAFKAFGETLNEPCLYVRFGDRWMSNATFDLMERMGARFDLTLEPGQQVGKIDERFLDWGQVPQYPYLPSENDFRIPGAGFKRGLWEIPLSAGSTDWLPEPLSLIESRVVAADVKVEGCSSSQNDLNSSIRTGNGSHEGYLDRVDSAYISGWAYDKSNPDTPLVVEICDGDVLLARVKAATFRPDLLASGKGSGKHCFNVPVPSWMKDGKPRLIHVKVAATGLDLGNSPQELIYSEMSSSEPYITTNLSLDTWPVCRIIDRVLSVEKDPYLAMVMRSDVCLHADQNSNMEQSLSHVLRHPSIGRLAFGTPDQLIERMR